MAISGSYDVTSALSNQSYAYKCWYNYNYGGNTMNISAVDMGKITGAWGSNVAAWREIAADDENSYEISDEDFNKAYENAQKEMKEETGVNGKNGKGITRTVATSTATAMYGGANMIMNTAGAFKNIGTVAKSIGKGVKSILKGGESAGKAAKTAGDTAKNAKSASKTCAYIAVAMAAIEVALYLALKPNKKEKAALDQLQSAHASSQAALSTEQGNMSDYSDEIISLSGEAEDLNEDTNDEIEEKKSEFDTYRETLLAIRDKLQSGEPLTEEERNLMTELLEYMEEIGININELSEDTQDEVGDIYDDIDDYSDLFDDSAETMAEVEGITDFAENFDVTTKRLCYVEAASQTLNAASAGIAAARLMAQGPWGWAAAAVGAAAAASSAVFAGQQIKMAKEIGQEVDLRKATQEMNETTQSQYDEYIDDYEGYMGIVEDLEIEMPDDLELPESSETTPLTATPSTDPSNDTDTDKPDKDK